MELHIFRLLINSCWFVFRWGLVAAVLLAIGVGGYLYLQLDEEIRRFAQATLAEHYTSHEVSVGSARFVPGRGVSLFDVRLSRRTINGTAAPQFEVSELRLVGDFDLQALTNGKPMVTRIEVRQPRLHAARGADGVWDCGSLWPPPGGEGSPPPVSITSGTVTLRDATAPNTPPYAISNIDVVIAAEKEASAVRPASSIDSTASDSPPGKPPVNIRGTVAGSLARLLKFEGRFSPVDGQMRASLEADGLHLTDDLLVALPNFESDRLNSGQLDTLRLDLRLAGKATVEKRGHEAPITWNTDFRVVSGGVDHPLLPRPISDLTITAHASQNTLQIAKLNARLGEAELSAAGDRRGWAADATTTATWRLIGLTLDEKLYYSLPAALRNMWNRFRPSGTIDATGSITFDGVRPRPDVTITCRGVSFEDHEQFPYRLTDATGAIRFVDRDIEPGNAKLDLNLIAQGEGRPIRVSAAFNRLPCAGDPNAEIPDCPFGWIEVRGDSLRVTDALLAALPDKAQEITKALRPRGEFSAFWRAERLTSDVPTVGTKTVITAKDVTAQFEHFPYPLRHVVGSLNEEKGRWWFENLTAQGAGGQMLTASGALDPPPPGTNGPHTFRMRLSGGATPMDGALRNALPTAAQLAWDELQPRGRIDFTADIFCQHPADTRIDIVVAPHQRDLAIEPRSFPYRMENIDGRFVFSDNRLTFQAARANHGRTQMEAGGSWGATPDGGWRLELNSLAVDRLDADHDFRLAAPIGLRRVIGRLDPQGSFSVHNGRILFTKPPGREDLLSAAWDLEFDFHQADLRGGVQIEDATGSVRIAGRSGGGGPTVTVGELQVDALFWNGLQLTNVRGPLWCDEQQCLFGAAAAAKQQSQATPEQPLQTTPIRRVTCQAYGGQASLNAQVIFDLQPRYGAAVSFNNIDLARFTSEYGHAQTPLAGRADGSLELQGLGVTVYGLGGTGEVHIREADLGELPVFVALLKALRGQAPDKSAFDRCDARFRLQGEHVSFDQLDLLGGAISLNGRGEARLDRSLDLTFRTLLGRSDLDAPMLRALVGQASEQLLTIRVGGSIDDPLIRRETLPLVGNVLRQFQQEQNRPTDSTQPPARRY